MLSRSSGTRAPRARRSARSRSSTSPATVGWAQTSSRSSSGSPLSSTRQRDLRVRLVRPTPAGQELQRVIESAIAGIERRWAAEVGPERWAAFREVLAEIGREQ